jgi:hypothetical protein
MARCVHCGERIGRDEFVHHRVRRHARLDGGRTVIWFELVFYHKECWEDRGHPTPLELGKVAEWRGRFRRAYFKAMRVFEGIVVLKRETEGKYIETESIKEDSL